MELTQIILRKNDTDHSQDWGEETNNNEKEIEEDKGWVEKAIDKVVAFFS